MDLISVNVGIYGNVLALCDCLLSLDAFLIKYYCCPINSIKYKNVVFGHCVFSGRVLFYSSMPPQKIDNW